MPFAIFIMMIVALIAFATVVAVMYYGTQEGDATPHAATDSSAVSIWKTRADDKQTRLEAASTAAQADPAVAEAMPDTPAKDTAIAEGQATGKRVGDLSEEEKEAKRAAALERRRKRAEMQAAKEAEEASA